MLNSVERHDGCNYSPSSLREDKHQRQEDNKIRKGGGRREAPEGGLALASDL